MRKQSIPGPLSTLTRPGDEASVCVEGGGVVGREDKEVWGGGGYHQSCAQTSPLLSFPPEWVVIPWASLTSAKNSPTTSYIAENNLTKSMTT